MVFQNPDYVSPLMRWLYGETTEEDQGEHYLKNAIGGFASTANTALNGLTNFTDEQYQLENASLLHDRFANIQSLV